MEIFQIKAFKGVSTQVESTDQDRGTLRRLEGAVIAPNGGISSPPSWESLWGIDNLETLLSSELVGKTDNFGYFFKLAKEGNELLIFYEKGEGIRGLWWVEQSDQYPLSSTSGSVTITDYSPIEIDLTGGVEKPYYGSWINSELWLGHGSRPNYIYSSGTLTELGATAPTDHDDPAVEQFPPCKSFVMMQDGAVAGAGHTAGTYPATRVWFTDRPNSRFPTLQRIRNLETSYTELSRAHASEITAISIWGEYVCVHTDRRPWVVRRAGAGSDGYFSLQDATPLTVSAPNPNCARDLAGAGAFWFASDREIYDDNSIRQGAIEKDYWKERDIATSKADTIWNERMSRNPEGAHTIFDRVNGRFYVFAPVKTNPDGFTADYTAFGSFIWTQDNNAVGGPMIYPNAVVSSVGRKSTPKLNKLVVGTAQGALLFSDLDELREREEYELEDYDAVINSEFTTESPEYLETEEGDVITLDPSGGPLVIDDFEPDKPKVWSQAVEDRDEDGYLVSFPDSETHASFIRYARTLFGNDELTAVLEPEEISTLAWENACVARLEFADEDFGSVNVEKVFQEVRLTWQRDSKCYVGVFVRTDYGQKDGYWIGNPWPDQEQLIGLNVRGRRLKLTILCVFSNHKDAKAMLRDVSIGFLRASSAQGPA